MKRYQLYIYVFLLFILLFILTGCNKNENNNDNSVNSSASKISTDVNLEQAENRVANILENKDKNETNNNSTIAIPKEQEIASYATTIKDKSSGRLTNINITCSSLNGTVIHNGEVFSFNKVVGKPTAERGYQEASVIIDHKTEKGIGGGNCQVSSTLYNAVLAVPNLVVTERHEHGKDVTYVPEGKDVAVSYGSGFKI